MQALSIIYYRGYPIFMATNEPSHSVKIEVSKLVEFNSCMEGSIRKVTFVLGISTLTIRNVWPDPH
jgi:hypothetical protein